MLKKTIFAVLVGGIGVGALPAVSALFPQDGLAKALTYSIAIAILAAAAVLALSWSSWLAEPLGSLEPGDGPEAQAALEEYHRRRVQVSLLAALAIYFGAGLGVTVAYHGPSACEGYLRLHLLDGFGCAGFFAVGWSQMDRHPERGAGLLTAATAGIAAAAAFLAGGTLVDVLLIGFLGLVYGYFIWGFITGRLRDTLARGRAAAASAARRLRPGGPGPSLA